MDKELVGELINNIESVANNLYQGDVKTGYSQLNELIPQIAVVSGQIQQSSQQQEIAKILGNALDAMEKNDNTLLADVLQYDLVEALITSN